MYDKRAYHVYPRFNAVNGHTKYCDEPQALVNICLTCPLPTCKPYGCKRYEIAKFRLKYKVFPLADAPVPKPVEQSKCERCEFGNNVGCKVFCPLVKCVKEEC